MSIRPYDPALKAELEAILAERAEAEAQEKTARDEAFDEVAKVLGRDALVSRTIII